MIEQRENGMNKYIDVILSKLSNKLYHSLIIALKWIFYLYFNVSEC